MRLEGLELVDYRSFRHARLDLGPGAHVLVGPNAQGKTNLLEAVHFLGIGASHRVAGEGPLVRSGAQAAIVRAVCLLAGQRRLTVELELRPAGRSRARVNGQPRPRTRDAIGLVRSVLFAPEDVSLVRGDPAERRRFLDDLLGQRRPSYLAARHEYERALRQRNTLLRHAGQDAPGEATLAAWTETLVRTGAPLLAARVAAVHALAGPAADAYRELVDTRSRAGAEVALSYQLSTGRSVPGRTGAGVPDPASLADELRAGLAAVAADERQRGTTLAGPHRDELRLDVGGLAARGYASHGEVWSLALALRLGSLAVLGEVGEEPIVLLDDVFAELDETRRARLARRCRDYDQVLVTAAVDEDVPLQGRRHEVRRDDADGAAAPGGVSGAGEA
ncbi:DNA replication/repair protein RecF [soil metagenome]